MLQKAAQPFRVLCDAVSGGAARCFEKGQLHEADAMHGQGSALLTGRFAHYTSVLRLNGEPLL